MNDRQLRIAVIGGGPAGLTAARTLKQLGYPNVTVFERRDEVGGKVRSVEVEGRTYDMGAIIAADSYRTVLPMAEAEGQQLIGMPDRVMVDVAAASTRSVSDYMRDRAGRREIATGLARYWRLMAANKPVYNPELAFAPKSLCRPFGELMADGGMRGIAPVLGPVYTVLGYGYAERMPALYVMRLMDRPKVRLVIKTALGREQSWPRLFPAGFQRLWKSVASKLDVKTGIGVEEVTRNGAVQLGLSDGSEQRFDRLVCAAPPGAASRFLDISEAEQEVFTRVRTIPYHVTLFESDRIPGIDHSRAYLEQHLGPDAIGRSMLLLHPHRDRDLYLSYAYGNATIGREQIIANLTEDVARLGGNIRRVHKHEAWTDYFPHADADALAGGVLERAAALQGQRATLFAGSFFGFETVEDAATQARALMVRAFG
jgi:predicted NAD/FAD-binding protein